MRRQSNYNRGRWKGPGPELLVLSWREQGFNLRGKVSSQKEEAQEPPGTQRVDSQRQAPQVPS